MFDFDHLLKEHSLKLEYALIYLLIVFQIGQIVNGMVAVGSRVFKFLEFEICGIVQDNVIEAQQHFLFEIRVTTYSFSLP